MSGKTISIVLPVYRQADHVEGTITPYMNALDKLDHPYELLLSVNGSGDKSLEVCRSLAANSPELRVIYTETPGWGRAVRRGLMASDGDLICYTNCARTTAEDLAHFIEYAIHNPGEVIKANRKVRESFRRRLGSLLYNLECRTLFDLPFWDVNGTPKVFPREFDRLLQLTRDDDLIDAEFCAICRMANYPLIEIPIFSTRRHGGRSTTSMSSAIKMYMGVLELKQSFRYRAPSSNVE